MSTGQDRYADRHPDNRLVGLQDHSQSGEEDSKETDSKEKKDKVKTQQKIQ